MVPYFFFDFLFEWYAKINTYSMYIDIEQKPEVGVSISTSGHDELNPVTGSKVNCLTNYFMVLSPDVIAVKNNAGNLLVLRIA
jgi:hypothetical protein